MTTRYALALFLAVGLHSPLGAQPDLQRQRAERQEKINAILRTKDLRTPHDGRLLSFLSDPDPTVRREATLAFGSIQDSGAIGPLTRNLTDPVSAIQDAAAFALGQTGTILSDQGRRSLGYDLIWKRIPTTRAVERLIEEIGKFGLQEALGDLMVKFGNLNEGAIRRGLTMSIARFAERGIITDDGVQYLLRFIRPAEATPREVAYALRRIGKHHLVEEHIEEIALLWRHPDPEVRMQLATLLEILQDASVSSLPLLTLARHDADWRVRVNAVRALGSLPGQTDEASVGLFAELFFDRNVHVALTALQCFPKTGIDPADERASVRDAIEQIRIVATNRSNNFPWQLQAEAADALAMLLGSSAYSTLVQARASHPRLEDRLFVALGRTGSEDAAGLLLASLSEGDDRLHAATLEGLAQLVERRPSDTVLVEHTFSALLAALGSSDRSVLGTASILLREPAYRRSEAVTPLISAARELHVPSDTEVLLEMITTLGALDDARAVPFLHDQLMNPDGVVRSAAASSLRKISGQEYPFPQRDGALVTDFDFGTLDALPDTIRIDMETTAGVIVLDLYTRVAPFTVMHLLKLERQRGFFRGVIFHRVVPNFVVQGGDPSGTGWGGPGWTIRSEFSPLSYEAGRIGMASAGKDTEGSQFFITHSWQPHLEGRYTLFGRVVAGQDVVDRIQVEERILGIRGIPEVIR